MAPRRQARQAGTVIALIALVAGMGGLVSYSVTLYQLFCQATGYGGTTRVAAAAPAALRDRVVTVRFNADVASGLAWRFGPVEREMRVRLGEQAVAVYRAINLSDRPVVGQASFNVTPDKTGRYFNKIQCFCFTEQRLAPGQSADMPVLFFLDPALADDRNLDDVTAITLSYTFFAAPHAPRVAIN